MDAGKHMNYPFRSTFSWHFVGTFLLLTATLAAAKLTSHRKSAVLARPLDSIDLRIAGLTGTDSPPLSDRMLARLLPTSYLARTYRKPGIEADLFIAFYSQQRAGESMHSPKHCLPGSGWEIWNYGSADIPVNGRTFRVNNYSISHEGERRLVLYWYQSKARIVASEYMGKILLARDALLQSSTEGSIVRIIVPDKPGALGEARAFASELILQVQRCLGS
jgi:EpsI family protein